MAMLWVLNYADGNHSLLDIVEKAEMSFDVIYKSGKLLLEHKLLK
nr:winged helix-turn-helix domain-containing protein [Haliscomenobacter sp.]